MEVIASPFCEVMRKCFYLKAKVTCFGLVVKEIRAITDLRDSILVTIKVWVYWINRVSQKVGIVW